MRNCNLEIDEQKCSLLSPKARLGVGAHVVSVVCPLGFSRAFYARSAREAAFGENSLQTMKLLVSRGPGVPPDDAEEKLKAMRWELG